MKSLKRTLSLVLVLVMVLGLVGISAGASFKDEAKINYKEAVGVMTGIGALVGYPDGTFNGTGTVTREEAVKTVVYSVLGADIAKTLAGTATGFADVDAGRWSSGVIAYAVSRGIVNGRDAKTFDPTGNVTANEVGKMMLCAAGYGAKGEFIGSSWELNTAILANQTGIFAGSKAANYSTPATREETALYAFNGITKTPMVQYAKADDLYKKVASVEGAGTYAKDGYLQIAENVYPKLATDPTPLNGVAGYTWMFKGNAITPFLTDATVLGTITDGTTITTVTTSTSPKFIAPLAADADLTNSTANDPVAYTINGKTVDAFAAGTYALGDLVVKDNKLYEITYAGSITTLSTAAGTASETLNNAKEYSVVGAIVTLNAGTGANAKKIVSVNVVEKFVLQLSATPILKTTGSLTTITIPGLGAMDVKTVSYPAGLVKGDVILYYTGNDGVTYIEKAQAIVGKTTGYNGTGIVVDGKTYTVSGLVYVAKQGGPAPYTIANIFDNTKGAANTAFYLDNNGSVCHFFASEAPIANDKVLFVAAADADTSTPLVGTSYKAIAVFADGTTKIITVSKVGARNGAAAAVSEIAATPATVAAGVLNTKTFYTYTVAADGSYILNAVETTRGEKTHFKAIDAAGANNAPGTTFGTIINYSADTDTFATITNGKADFLTTYTVVTASSTFAGTDSHLLANSSTVFVVMNSDGKTFKTYTGIANVPNTTICAEAATVDVMMNATGSYASLVVVGANTPSTSATSSDAFFLLSAPEYVFVDGVKDYRKANVLLNGAPAEMKFVTSDIANLAVGNALKVTGKTGDLVSAVAVHTAAVPGITKLAIADGTISLYTGNGGATYNSSGVLATGVKAFVLNTTTKTFEAVDVASLPMVVYGNSVVVTMVPVSTLNHAISTIFITMA